MILNVFCQFNMYLRQFNMYLCKWYSFLSLHRSKYLSKCHHPCSNNTCSSNFTPKILVFFNVTMILSQLFSFLSMFTQNTICSPHFYDLFTNLSPIRVCFFIFMHTFWKMVIPLPISLKLIFSWQGSNELPLPYCHVFCIIWFEPVSHRSKQRAWLSYYSTGISSMLLVFR